MTCRLASMLPSSALSERQVQRCVNMSMDVVFHGVGIITFLYVTRVTLRTCYCYCQAVPARSHSDFGIT